MKKAILGLFAAVFATIVAANVTYNAVADKGSEPINQPWQQDRMEFVAWNNEQWTAWIIDEAFEQTPQDTGKWSRHSNPSLAFVDWSGEMWQAKTDGAEFLLARRGDWNGPILRTNAIRYRDWQGRNQVRTTAQLRR